MDQTGMAPKEYRWLARHLPAAIPASSTSGPGEAGSRRSSSFASVLRSRLAALRSTASDLVMKHQVRCWDASQNERPQWACGSASRAGTLGRSLPAGTSMVRSDRAACSTVAKGLPRTASVAGPSTIGVSVPSRPWRKRPSGEIIPQHTLRTIFQQQQVLFTARVERIAFQNDLLGLHDLDLLAIGRCCR